MSITAVAPDPRNSTVSSILITFSEAANGFDRDDLVLSRNGTNISWTSQTLDPDLQDPTRYTLSGLSSLTGAEGTYALTLKPAHGITDIAGNALANSPTESWLMDTTAPTVTIAPPDLNSAIVITFNEPVSGLDLQDLSLSRDSTAIAMSEPAQTLVPTPGGRVWTLSGLQSLTSRLGSYSIAINAGSGIIDAAGNPLSGNPSASFIVDAIVGDQSPSLLSDTIRLSAHDGDATLADVQVNSDPVYTVRLAGLASIHVLSQAGDDHITLDFTRGSPLPAGGVSINGGDGADTILAIGSDAADSAALSTGSLSFNGSSISFAALESITLDTGAGDDSLSLDSANLPATRFKGGSGVDTMQVNAGSYNFAADASADTANLRLIVSNAAVTFAAAQHLARLELRNATATMTADESLLSLGELSLDDQSTLELDDSDMIIRSTSANRADVLEDVAGRIDTARNTKNNKGELWHGRGINSLAARADVLTGLAAIINEQIGPTGPVRVRTDFAGETPGIDWVLVKHTWNGDVDLNGVVNADDYYQVDSGFLDFIRQTGTLCYRRGNLDYNTAVNADDYYLIDSAFLQQRGRVLAAPPPAAATARPVFNSVRRIGAKAKHRRAGKAAGRERHSTSRHSGG